MTLTNSNQPRRRRAHAGLRTRPGFSVMEMLVVVIVVGIIMSVAGVRVSGMMSQQRVIRAANTVQTQMELAFAVAARNRSPTAIVWSPGSMILQVTDRDITREYGRVDMKQIGLPFGAVTTSSNNVNVFPNGFASDTLSLTFSVTSNGTTYSRRVRMSRAGLVKVI
jgi:prepilin-type N-terminal cleavage/methylation domain-containing protein